MQTLRRILEAGRNGAETRRTCVELVEAVAREEGDLAFCLLYVVREGIAELAAMQLGQLSIPGGLARVDLADDRATTILSKAMVSGRKGSLELTAGDFRGVSTGAPYRAWIARNDRLRAGEVRGAIVVLGVVSSGQSEDVDDDFLNVASHLMLGNIESSKDFESAESVTNDSSAVGLGVLPADSVRRAKDEFLALLGHELRNPLTPITTALDLMRQKKGDHERERIVIERQVEHLRRLVDDLLDVSRITRGKVVLKKASVETAEFVAKAIELASPLLEERQHHLMVDVAATGLLILGDCPRLAQAIANLLTNAAQYTPRGGHISLVATAQEDEVVICVNDDGTGIDDVILPHVFDMFVQEGQPLARSQGGLGLGLALVRSIVALHGGRVVASSAGKGRGSQFVVHLQRAAESAPRSMQSSPQLGPGALQVGHRILIVDDNIDAAEMLAEWLAGKGHDVRVAHDGPSGIAKGLEFEPAIGLIDIGLPAMDGYEVARRIRSEPTIQGMQLIAVTGYGQAKDRQEALDSGFDSHMVKPIDLKALDAILDRASKRVER